MEGQLKQITLTFSLTCPCRWEGYPRSWCYSDHRCCHNCRTRRRAGKHLLWRWQTHIYTPADDPDKKFKKKRDFINNWKPNIQIYTEVQPACTHSAFIYTFTMWCYNVCNVFCTNITLGCHGFLVFLDTFSSKYK